MTTRMKTHLVLAGLAAAGAGVFVYVTGCASCRRDVADRTYTVLSEGGEQAFRRLETSGPCLGGIGWVGGYFRGTGAGTCSVSLTSESGQTATFRVALTAEEGTSAFRVARVIEGPVSLHNDTLRVQPMSCDARCTSALVPR